MKSVSAPARNAVGEQEVEVFLLHGNRAESAARNVMSSSISLSYGWAVEDTQCTTFASVCHPRRRRRWRWLLPQTQPRLQLSRAKHPSLAGHRRWSRRMARLVPFYDYDDEQFFRRRRRPGRGRRAAPRRLRAPGGAVRGALRQDCAAATRGAGRGISDLQFTSRYRVPFQFSRPGAPAPAGRQLPACVRVGRHASRTWTATVLRPDRLLRRQPVRLRLLQGLHRAGSARGARARARCWAPITRRGRTTCSGCARSPAWTRCRSTCRAPRP